MAVAGRLASDHQATSWKTIGETGLRSGNNRSGGCNRSSRAIFGLAYCCAAKDVIRRVSLGLRADFVRALSCLARLGSPLLDCLSFSFSTHKKRAYVLGDHVLTDVPSTHNDPCSYRFVPRTAQARAVPRIKR